LDGGFDVGVAVSGIIQTFAFTVTKIKMDWWGNNVAASGPRLRQL
jgi:hypothetical protein